MLNRPGIVGTHSPLILVVTVRLSSGASGPIYVGQSAIQGTLAIKSELDGYPVPHDGPQPEWTVSLWDTRSDTDDPVDTMQGTAVPTLIDARRIAEMMDNYLRDNR